MRDIALLKRRLATYRDMRDLADHDIDRLHAEGESLLARLFVLIERGDTKAALDLINCHLGQRGRA